MYCYIAFICCAIVSMRKLRRFAIVAVLLGLVLTIGAYSSLEHIARGFVGFFAGHLVWKIRDYPISARWLAPVALVPLFVAPPLISYGAFLSVTAWPAVLLLAMQCNFLLARPFRWLGDRSYSIYLLHAPVYFWVSALMLGGRAVPEAEWTQVTAICVVIVLLASDISYRFFENPIRIRIKRLFGNNSAPQEHAGRSRVRTAVPYPAIRGEQAAETTQDLAVPRRIG